MLLWRCNRQFRNFLMSTTQLKWQYVAKCLPSLIHTAQSNVGEEKHRNSCSDKKTRIAFTPSRVSILWTYIRCLHFAGLLFLSQFESGAAAVPMYANHIHIQAHEHGDSFPKYPYNRLSHMAHHYHVVFVRIHYRHYTLTYDSYVCKTFIVLVSLPIPVPTNLRSASESEAKEKCILLLIAMPLGAFEQLEPTALTWCVRFRFVYTHCRFGQWACDYRRFVYRCFAAVVVVPFVVHTLARLSMSVFRLCTFSFLNWNHSVGESTEDDFVLFDSFSFGMLKRSLRVRSTKFVNQKNGY